jgi:hypothetical protein
MPAMTRACGLRRIALLAALVLAACAGPPPRGEPERVLFVGNSLIYVGNVPAVYAALASANGHATASDMIVEGGATLAQRAGDDTVARALAQGSYTAVVLQERGGDLICSFGPVSCSASRDAIKKLAGVARAHDARVFMLGTYQFNPGPSRTLVRAERAAARDAGIGYVEVSAKLEKLRGDSPGLAWLAADGMHPGKDLALLDAVLVYRARYGAWPQPHTLAVPAPDFGIRSGLTPVLRAADAAPPLAQTPRQIDYSFEVVARIIETASRADSG